jgi:hypothetical protein
MRQKKETKIMKRNKHNNAKSRPELFDASDYASVLQEVAPNVEDHIGARRDLGAIIFVKPSYGKSKRKMKVLTMPLDAKDPALLKEICKILADTEDWPVHEAAGW